MFNYKKAIQILAWLLRKYNGGVASKILLIKLIYFADKYHLRKYGRTVSGDEYKAMNFGPVASKTLNVADQNEYFLDLHTLKMATNAFEIMQSGRMLRLINIGEDTNALSKTDLEALDFAYSKFGKEKPFDLAEYTHQYAEWAKHKNEILSEDNPNGKKSVPMDIRDFLEDAPVGAEPCYELTAEDKTFILDMINESEAFDKFFKKN